MEVMTVVVLFCLATKDGDRCQEEIVGHQPSTTSTCIVSMAELVEWKMKSEFKADEWIMKRIDCHKGDYKTKKTI